MKKKKIISIVIFLIILFNVLNNIVYAAGFATSPLEFKDKSNTSSKLYTATESVIGTAVTLIRIVAMGAAIVMLTYMAIKYMSAAPAERAEFKKSATIYIVGAILLFGTTGVLGIIENFAKENF